MKTMFAMAAVTLLLASGAASAASLATLRQQHAFGLGTTSAISRNVGPGSTATNWASSPYGSANNGMGQVPGAPTAGNVTGGN